MSRSLLPHNGQHLLTYSFSLLLDFLFYVLFGITHPWWLLMLSYSCCFLSVILLLFLLVLFVYFCFFWFFQYSSGLFIFLKKKSIYIFPKHRINNFVSKSWLHLRHLQSFSLINTNKQAKHQSTILLKKLCGQVTDLTLDF